MSGSRQRLGIVLALLLLMLSFSPLVQIFFAIPKELRIAAGSPYLLQLPLPLDLTVDADQEGLTINEVALAKNTVVRHKKGSYALLSKNPISASLNFRLFGLLPLRKLKVHVEPPISVAPSGHSIGITIKATTMVVGLGTIKTENGVRQPAKDAGMEIGDLILAVNGRPEPSVSQIGREIVSAGGRAENVEVLVQRGEEELTFLLEPVYCLQAKAWRIGLYIRDDAAGVGTLTFVDRKNNTFAALGHIIADAETNQALAVKEGKVVRSRVTAIEQGRSGFPGEKRTIIIDESNILGLFTANTGIGIFGEVLKDITAGCESLPVALMDQVMPGDAEILTVISGEKVERFAASIVRVTKQYSPHGKGLVVKITDPRLLAETGGIVQGMSGSPILQDGRLVGAITHVFVNKPDTGYGVFAEWMVRQTGILEKREEILPAFFYRRYLGEGIAS